MYQESVLLGLLPTPRILFWCIYFKGENINKTNIDWCDFSWNPVSGCDHGCWYCYARKMSQRFKKLFPNGFKPTFHPERLKEPYTLKKPSKIFVCSIADLFASWTPCVWRNAVLDAICNCPIKHTFILLTKNPENIPKDFVFPINVWVGTTVTMENGDWKNIEEIKTINAKVKFVSFEPLLGLIPDNVDLNGLQWVIIGKLTGSKKVKLDNYWVSVILDETKRHDIPVFMKKNLCPDWPKHALIQQFPQ